MRQLSLLIIILTLLFAATDLTAQQSSNPDPLIDHSYGTGGFANHPQSPYNLGFQAQCNVDRSCIAVRQVTGNGDVFEIYRLLEDGRLDTSFGNNGLRRLSFPNYWITASQLQPDGKILIGGYIQSNAANSTLDLFMIRLDPEGNLDPEFGKDGVFVEDLTVPGFNAHDRVTDIAIQADGRIIICGISSRSVLNGVSQVFAMILRLNPDGTPDNAFGDSGLFIHHIGEDSTIINVYGSAKVGLQNDGRITAGFCVKPVYSFDQPYSFSVLRLTSDGILDPDFSTDGITEIASSLAFGFQAIKALPDGKTLCLLANGSLIQLDEKGGVDMAFGNNGRLAAVADFWPTDMSIHTNGKIVVSGIKIIFSPRRDAGVVRRFFADGTLDSRYGSGGTFSVESTDSDIRFGLIQIVGDDKYYVHALFRILNTSPYGQLFTLRLHSRRATKIRATSPVR